MGRVGHPGVMGRSPWRSQVSQGRVTCPPKKVGFAGCQIYGWRRQRHKSLPPTLSLCLFPQTITCFFTVDAEPWKTEFQLLNDTCLEGSAV